ncbi:MAG: hypothetical protein E7361_03750 [Clostridiales bacterium]|nr:hypothetical protein [Clostridiales bacterium]
MDIKDLAIVRVNNTIPYGGIVKPICNTGYLTKDAGSTFAFEMNSLLRRKGKLVSEDQPNADELNEKIQKSYLPYSSSYNSMSLWCINGVVPDERENAVFGNNNFSHKNVVVIDSLEAHMDDNLLSMNPTDTAIHGNTKLSHSARVMIRQEFYDRLTPEQISMLNDLNIKTFAGDMKTAVDKNLTEMGYTPETLSLKRDDNGYKKSETSDELIATIEKVATDNKKSMEYHHNILTMQTDDKDKFECVKDEFKNDTTVRELYEKTFFNYIFRHLNLDKSIEYECINYSSAFPYMEQLCDEIDAVGLDNYKACVDNYNHTIETLRGKGILPTPQDIVDANKAKQPIDLLSIIEHEMENEQEM